VKIPVAHGHLEMALRHPDSEPRGGAVLCHPHPVQGGTMHSKSVYRAGLALNGAGLRTLRFNFRGVGFSTGSFDDGIGEEEDVQAAIDWMELGLPGRPLVVGGVSFGSMVGLKVGVGDPRVVALLAMGAPVHVYDYSFLASTRKPVLVVQGEEDHFGSGAEVSRLLGGLGDHVTVRLIPGAGHLFEGSLDDLQDTIQAYFTVGAGAEALENAGRRSGKTGS